MREDPHKGKVPGLGCGCKLCREPAPDVPFMSAAEIREARAAYESDRGLMWSSFQSRAAVEGAAAFADDRLI